MSTERTTQSAESDQPVAICGCGRRIVQKDTRDGAGPGWYHDRGEGQEFRWQRACGWAAPSASQKAESDHSTGAVVPVRQRCICNDMCLGVPGEEGPVVCRACLFLDPEVGCIREWDDEMVADFDAMSYRPGLTGGDA